MKASISIVRGSAALLVFAFQLSCGGSDSSGPVVPSTISANSSTTLTGSTGTTVQDRPSVIVRDDDGSPLAGVTVTFVVTSGGGSVTGGTRVTDASGVATVTSWTLGSAAGSNTVTASAASLPPVVFTATSSNPCLERTPHTFGATTNGELTNADCRLQTGEFRDLLSTTVSAAGAYAFTQTAGFDSFIVLFGADGFAIGYDDDDEGATSQNSRLKVLLPAADYLIGATTFDPGVTGAYTISSASTTEAVTNCEEVFAARGITTAQSLETTDCFFTGLYSDDMLIFLRAGQAITVNMTSSAFDAFLELWEPGNRLAFNDDADATTDNARLTYTPILDGFYFVVPTSAVAGATGAYTLTIQ